MAPFPLVGLERFPIALHVGGSLRLHVPEDVGMAVNQFGRKAIEDVVNREGALLVRHFGVEKHLQQKVSKLALEFVPITIVDSFENFVSFFERVGLNVIEGLFAIPGAAARSAQSLHDADGAGKTVSGGGHRQSM